MAPTTNGNHKLSTENNKNIKFLVYGKTGMIGGMVGRFCEKLGIPYEYGLARIEDMAEVEADMDRVNPTHVICPAGVNGVPNVDWCESHKLDTIRSNVIGPLVLADVCEQRNIYLQYYGTGCMFNYDKNHPIGSGIGFSEDDESNYSGSYYSKTKGLLEGMLKEYNCICILRIRMPIVADLKHPRNFITKILGYQKICSIPNSMTVLEELIPYSIEMARRNRKGIWNFVNPGVISHNEILELHKKYVDPSLTWANFSHEEQRKILACDRCNNELDASKLKSEFPQMLGIKDSIIKYIYEPNKTSV